MEFKEDKIKLNTMNGQATFSTPNMKGKLDCIIIDTQEKVNILVESEIGYPILLRNDVVGINYFAPRARTMTPKEDLTEKGGLDKFNLNEPLAITLMGRKNQEVVILFRFS